LKKKENFFFLDVSVKNRVNRCVFHWVVCIAMQMLIFLVAWKWKNLSLIVFWV